MPHLKKILLVDDDAEDRFIVFDALNSLDCSSLLMYAENGEAAIQILKTIDHVSDLPCLVVLDLNMPKMNGTETLRYLKSSSIYQHIPVIIYSTSENDLERDKCLNLGAHDYIIKPSSVKEWKKTTELLLSFCG